MPRYDITTISRNPDTWLRLGLRQYLNDCKRRARDLRPLWPEVLTIIHDNMREVFDNEGAVDGQPRWADLSRRPIGFHGKMTRTFRTSRGGYPLRMTYNPSYAQWKAYNYPGRKIGQLSGKLRAQLVGARANPAYVRMTRGKLTFGTDYTRYPLGVGRPRSRRDRLTGDLGGIFNAGRENYYPMPAREIFRVTDASIEQIFGMAVVHIMGSRP
jgi:hypothetical protein